MKNEVRAIKKLCNGSHEKLVEVFDVGDLPLHALIDMELCDGDLDDYNKSFWKQQAYNQSAEMQTQPIWNIMKQIANGLAFIHRKKEIHRDLKPKNGHCPKGGFADIVVLYARSSDTWKLTDFGLTSEASSNGLQNTEASRGSTGYRAPELLRDNATYSNKVDVWALGCILHELVTGQKLFLSDPVAFQQYDITLDIFVNGRIDDASLTIFKENIEGMLQKDPLRRPAAGYLFERFCAYHYLAAPSVKPVSVPPNQVATKSTFRDRSIEIAFKKVQKNSINEVPLSSFTIQSIVDLILQCQMAGRSSDAYEALSLLMSKACLADAQSYWKDAIVLRKKVIELRARDVETLVETDVMMLENMRDLGIDYQENLQWSESVDILEKTLYCEMQVGGVGRPSRASTEEALKKAYLEIGLEKEASDKAAREMRIKNRFEKA